MDDPFANSRRIVESLQSEVRRLYAARDDQIAHYAAQPEILRYALPLVERKIAEMHRDIIYYRSNMPPYITDEGNGVFCKHPVLEPIDPMEPVPTPSASTSPEA